MNIDIFIHFCSQNVSHRSYENRREFSHENELKRLNGNHNNHFTNEDKGKIYVKQTRPKK